VGDPTGVGWVGLVAAAARGEGHELTAYNLGVRRGTSVDVSRRWRSEARERLKDGDLFGVVFAVGTNDVAVHRGRPRVPRARSLTTLADMLDDAHTALWPTLVIGPPPLQDRRGNAQAAELATGSHPSTCGYERLAGLVKAVALPWLADLAIAPGQETAK
jgi:lysophospholipase L1-like esterase